LEGVFTRGKDTGHSPLLSFPLETANEYEALKAAYEALQDQNKAYLEERQKLVDWGQITQ